MSYPTEKSPYYAVIVTSTHADVPDCAIKSSLGSALKSAENLANAWCAWIETEQDGEECNIDADEDEGSYTLRDNQDDLVITINVRHVLSDAGLGP